MQMENKAVQLREYGFTGEVVDEREKEMSTDKVKEGCFIAIIGIGCIPLAWVSQGWAVALLWEWYIVPLGAISIGPIHGIGIAMIANLLTHQSTELLAKKENMEASDYVGIFVGTIIGPLLTLFCGWFIHHWMI